MLETNQLSFGCSVWLIAVNLQLSEFVGKQVITCRDEIPSHLNQILSMLIQSTYSPRLQCQLVERTEKRSRMPFCHPSVTKLIFALRNWKPETGKRIRDSSKRLLGELISSFILFCLFLTKLGLYLISAACFVRS